MASTPFTRKTLRKPPVKNDDPLLVLAREATAELQQVFLEVENNHRSLKAGTYTAVSGVPRYTAKMGKRDLFELTLSRTIQAVTNEGSIASETKEKEASLSLARAILVRRDYHIRLAAETSWAQSDHYLRSGIHGMETATERFRLQEEWLLKVANAGHRGKGLNVSVQAGPKAFTVPGHQGVDEAAEDNKLAPILLALASPEKAVSENTRAGKKGKKGKEGSTKKE
jgi:hypothetical protein